MSNGWDWIQEGQRIAEESRRAGEVDIEAIKASSIVFEGPLDTLQAVSAGVVESQVAEPAPAVGGFVGDLADMVRELENCRAGHCEAAYKQNSQGGEARHVVAKVAMVLGFRLGDAIVDRNVWSPANMARVIKAAQDVVNENEELRKELAGRDQKDNRTVAALREALIHAGEAV
ncbi:hypothetical protein SEA_TRVXSCOTT_56 [Streptomyces phage TrvxScott]|uniref:Uncharacterized protein n=1 Tax=Streptomyces phage Thestral TaxID=2301715 RepID=A0A385E312_9CAUD|nr:hypothetical protein KGG90_gp27 [Streptomyces phage Thestral]AXQ62382.1 hypothetical protein SEA_TRVXSCOTT_56 [Streptomyces phage TrvxScott]AXQ65255.1 hypothetical protein SEA_THESTRAL_59 [Streptomyces phage Thestral]QAY15715.1 hypothetical protein SEA_BOWDEN_57 [Streptomyces phage Bowden]